MDIIYGFLAAIGSIILFGSAGVPLRIKKIRQLQTFESEYDLEGVHPMVFHIYLLVGIVLTSPLLYAYIPIEIDYIVVIAAIGQTIIFIPSNILAISAIQQAGLAIAISIWAGTSIIVSFAWGVGLLSNLNKINSIPFCIIALILLFLGITNFMISFKLEEMQNDDSNDDTNDDTDDDNNKHPWKGILYALMVGFLNGSLLVPFQYMSRFTDSNDDVFAFNVIIVFAFCSLFTGSIFVSIYFAYKRLKGDWCEIPSFHFKWGSLAGISVGIMWSIGNICSVYATLFLGFSLGFPLSQLALVINACWGIIVFRELTHPISICIWITAIISLLAGAVILSDSLNDGIF